MSRFFTSREFSFKLWIIVRKKKKKQETKKNHLIFRQLHRVEGKFFFCGYHRWILQILDLMEIYVEIQKFTLTLNFKIKNISFLALYYTHYGNKSFPRNHIEEWWNRLLIIWLRTRANSDFMLLDAWTSVLSKKNFFLALCSTHYEGKIFPKNHRAQPNSSIEKWQQRLLIIWLRTRATSDFILLDAWMSILCNFRIRFH